MENKKIGAEFLREFSQVLASGDEEQAYKMLSENMSLFPKELKAKIFATLYKRQVEKRLEETKEENNLKELLLEMEKYLDETEQTLKTKKAIAEA